MTGNHQKFLEHLDASHAAVWAVAAMLNRRGYTVSIPAANTKRQARHEDWKEFSDNGDLFISQRIEVKQLSVNFTSAEDWPFGEKFMVCAKHSFDRATPRPYAYIILSRDGDYAAAVFYSTVVSWYVETRRDTRYDDYEQEFYFCPLANVQFFKMQ